MTKPGGAGHGQTGHRPTHRCVIIIIIIVIIIIIMSIFLERLSM